MSSPWIVGVRTYPESGMDASWRAGHTCSPDYGDPCRTRDMDVCRKGSGRGQPIDPSGGRPRYPGTDRRDGDGERLLLAGAPRAVEAEVGWWRVGRVVPPPGEAHVRYLASLRDPVPAA